MIPSGGSVKTGLPFLSVKRRSRKRKYGKTVNFSHRRSEAIDSIYMQSVYLLRNAVDHLEYHDFDGDAAPHIEPYL